MGKTKLKIHVWPEKILRKNCRRVEKFDDDLRQSLNEMQELMQSYEGVGLAANQVGLDISLVIIETADRIFKLVNPRIKKKEGLTKFIEGCLSFPRLELEVKRAKKIWVEAQDEYGNKMELEVEDLLAVIFQHEIDHIEGILFIDRVSFWQRLKALPIFRKIKKRTKNAMCK